MYRKRKRKESVDVCIFDAPELSFCALQKAYSENPLKAHEVNFHIALEGCFQVMAIADHEL